MRARIDAGFTYPIRKRGVLSFNGFYDGLGASDYELYGATIEVNLPLN